MQIKPVIAPLMGRLAFLPSAIQRRAMAHLATVLEGPLGVYPLLAAVRTEADSLHGAEAGIVVDPAVVTHVLRFADMIDSILENPTTREAANAAQKLKEMATSSFAFAPDRRTDVTRYFGKIVPSLWAADRPETLQEIMTSWAFSNRSGRDRELHFFSSDRGRASKTLLSLSEQGFDARNAEIPPSSVPSSVHKKTMHWVVARSGGNDVTRTIHRLFETPAHSDLPAEFLLMDRPVDRARIDSDPDEVNRAVASLFGRPVPWEDIVRAFQVDVPGYRMGRLSLSRAYPGVEMKGEVRTDRGRPAATFRRLIPPPPPPGGLWIAEGHGYDADPALVHAKKGIARRLHQRFFGFLYRLGVDVFDMGADRVGPYAWPRLGFDFAHSPDLETVKDMFLDYLKEQNALSKDAEEAVRRIRHAWEIASFESQGISLGKNFLLGLTLMKRREIRLRFPIGDPRYPGWRILFGSLLDPPKQIP